jgi:DNA-binding XRE family transcriptional regulator
MNDYQAHLEDALSKIKFDKEQDLPHVEQYDIDNEVRQLVILTRNSLKMTQNQLAELSGVTQANISKIENGSYTPSLAVLQRLANGFGKRLIVAFGDLEELE